MVKEHFDRWCSNELPKIEKELIKKYPRCKKTIKEDLSNFYENVISKALDSLEDPRGYLFSFIYNKHYRFYKGNVAERTDHILYTKNCQIKVTNKFIEYSEEDMIEDIEDRRIEKIREILITLPLYDINLYNLYYVQGKTIRNIAENLDLSIGGIHKRIKKLELKIKNLLC